VELTNEFTIGLPIDEAWAMLTDLERVAPCMPGAELQSVEGDEYHGEVKVKVGPITARYRGVASLREADEAAGRAVIRAEGRDTRGQGNAAATITVDLAADGQHTRVDVHTDLAITGKVAQFGRGVLADVSRKLMTQFVQCLEAKAVDDPAPAAGSQVSPPGAGSHPQPAAPVDLLAISRSSVLKRLGPPAALLVILLLWLSRRR